MLTKSVAATALAFLVSVSAAHAQATPQPAAAPQKPAVGRPVATPPPAVEMATPVRPEPIGQAVNVKLELTISDQTGTAEPLKKTISVIVADRANGYVRSQNGPMRLNVDASPQLLPGSNTARVRISVEYMPRQANGEASPAMLNEAVTVVLENGKPFVISQAADPSADRKITIEAKLTVLK